MTDNVLNPGYADDSGGIYNPAADAWTPVSKTDAPSARAGHTAIWAQDRMIVWGGKGADDVPLDDGYVFFPGNNTWQKIQDINAPSARFGHTAVWTGSEMIVWGGEGLTDGGAYNPATDTWRTISSQNAPSSRLGHGAVWCGNRMAVWGGSTLDSGPQSNGTGAFYDPSADIWTSISPSDAPSGGYGEFEDQGERAVQLFWTGQKLGVFVVNVTDFGGPRWVRGGFYDPTMQSWETISAVGAPNTRPYFGAWTGSTLFIASSSFSSFSGCAYNFSSNRWDIRVTGTTGSFQGRQGAWAPERGELLVFGGRWATGTSDPTWSGGPNGQRGFRVVLGTNLPKPQGISFNLPPKIVYGRTYTLGARATSNLPVSYDVDDAGVAEIVGGNRLRILQAGSFTVTARQDGDTAWAPADPVALEAIAEKRPQFISLVARRLVRVGQTFNLRTWINSELPLTIESSNPSVLRVDGLAATAAGRGTVTLTATQEGDDNHHPARPAIRTVTVR